jgi:hypothetical protein
MPLAALHIPCSTHTSDELPHNVCIVDGSNLMLQRAHRLLCPHVLTHAL